LSVDEDMAQFFGKKKEKKEKRPPKVEYIASLNTPHSKRIKIPFDLLQKHVRRSSKIDMKVCLNKAGERVKKGEGMPVWKWYQSLIGGEPIPVPVSLNSYFVNHREAMELLDTLNELEQEG
jgi:hypothetical protein